MPDLANARLSSMPAGTIIQNSGMKPNCVALVVSARLLHGLNGLTKDVLQPMSTDRLSNHKCTTTSLRSGWYPQQNWLYHDVHS